LLKTNNGQKTEVSAGVLGDRDRHKCRKNASVKGRKREAAPPRWRKEKG